ncbi:hypothetical protein ZYGR_0AK00630 [Zygosaccharomyces rouxii]|uniref:Choline/carnitine acyltransferase domain-containing protein n=1 Tax=Zygosaccharomyces rouxii TaxID=4956 RepID=A0A1Q3AD38_ZYGRO|nr:hypothetical protein ZYGR_0AK00630 [Zygosaccharomyces rouxii]
MPSIEEVGGNSTFTLEYESSLSRLPLPNASRTLEQLQDSLKPLYFSDGYYRPPMDHEKLQEFSRCIKDFLNSELCDKLQSTLENYHASSSCYLDSLHLDNNYFARDLGNDVLPRNPLLLLEDDILPKVSQVDRSAVLVHAALRFISALKKRVLPPERGAGTGLPLTMSPYENLFGSTRCPVLTPGEVESFDLNKPFSDSDLESTYVIDRDEKDDAEDSDESSMNDTFTRHSITIRKYSDSKHLLVISRGQYYTVEVLDDKGNVLYDPTNLITVFDYILKDSIRNENSSASTALGSLTSHSFHSWKYARKRLERKFPDELRLIDSALFILVLDHSSFKDDGATTESGELQILSDSEENSMANSARNLKRLFYGTSILNGNGRQMGSCVSRWYDKLQLVVTEDSEAAVIWDSFTCDGSAVLRFTSETYTESILRLAREVNLGDPRFSLWPSINSISTKNTSDKKTLEPDPVKITHKIEWKFSDILNTHIHLSETKLADLISRYDMIRLSIPFGRRDGDIWGVRPDAMIQVALQVAHFALYGKMIYGVEPVSTRGFKNSRSCFIDIQSDELLELCREFITSSLDDVSKLNKFLKACKLHIQKVKNAKAGDGFEKHFNALRCLFKFNEHYGISLDSNDSKVGESIFESPVLSPFLEPEFLAANCGNAATTAFAITPDIPNGFGVGYTIKDDCCDLTVTSQFRQGGRLMFMLNWVLSEISKMWKGTTSGTLGKWTGYKISPIVDKLYEMDNALKHTGGSNEAISGYGFFNLHPQWDSANVSEASSVGNSSVHLPSSDSNSRPPLVSPLKHSSTAHSVPTEREKHDTGFQIKRFNRFEGLPQEVSEQDMADLPSGTSSSKSNNVINSRFEINFDRGMVGKKVTSVFDELNKEHSFK